MQVSFIPPALMALKLLPDHTSRTAFWQKRFGKSLELGVQPRYVLQLGNSVVVRHMHKKMKEDVVNAAGPGPAAPEPPAAPEAAQTLPAAVTLSAEQIEDLKQRAAKADENWDRFLRHAADFENYKKRAVRERQEAIGTANEALLQRLLPTLDAFEMALAAALPDPASQALRTGIVMVSSQLKSTLAEAGLEEIDATDKVFDPAFHQAVSQQETAEVPEGHVVRQVRKGYKFRSRLLRPAGVIVAKKPVA
jgi:molecular chaperone GrpE